MQEKHKRTIAYQLAALLPIAAGAGWGSVGLFIRMLDEAGMDNVTIVFSRNLAGFIMAAIFLLFFKREAFIVKKRDIPIMVMQAVVGSILMMLFYNIAVVELSLSLAAVILSTAPVFVLLVSAVIFKERITLKKVLCMLGAFLGIAMLSGLFETTGMKWSLLGLGMGILAMMASGAWMLMCKSISNRGYSSLTVCVYSFLFTAIILAPFADWSMLSGFVVSQPAVAFTGVVLQALLASLLPTVVYMVGLSYLDAGKTAILEGGAEPTSALLIGLFVFSEVPSFIGFAGVVLTIVALAVLAGDSN